MEHIKEPIKRALARLGPLAVRYQYALIVLLAGILMLCLDGGAGTAKPQGAPPAEAADGFDLPAFEAELQARLGEIRGVGKVQLMLSLEETGEAVYASNVRESAGERYESTLSTVSDGSYGEQPVPIKRRCPTFRGAVVLCEGADDSAVQLAVTRAVSAVCGLGADRISVIAMG